MGGVREPGVEDDPQDARVLSLGEGGGVEGDMRMTVGLVDHS